MIPYREGAKRQLRERTERELSKRDERELRELREKLKTGPKERAWRETQIKRVQERAQGSGGEREFQERAQGKGSLFYSLLSSYVLCPPKGEAAIRLL